MPATSPSFAVVGAGIAGLACARALASSGRAVAVFDKGRTPGGRIATRRVDAPGAGGFDHGAAFFTVRDPRFAAAIAPLAAAGQVAPWQPSALAPDDTRFVGVPGMSALPRALAAGLEVRCGVRVEGLRRTPAGWLLDDAAGATHGPFDGVAIALPAPQAAALLASAAPGLAAEAGRAAYAPCWAVLAAWEAPLGLGREVWQADDGPVA